MRNDRQRRMLLTLAGLAAAGLASPPASRAQAWLPPKGEATLSLGYQNIYARDHIFSAGQRVDRGFMHWNHVLPDLDYGVTDRLAVRVGLPYVFSKYNGQFPHRPAGRATQDDGLWHRTFQDFRLEARFMAARGSLVVTPFVGMGLPTRSYETFSHVAAGRGLRELSGGVYLGRRLDPLLPEAYAQSRLSFTVPERVLDISHNRSNANLELGYFVTPSLTVRTVGAFQKTYGGWRIPEDAGPPTGATFRFHDQLARDDHFVLGAGASMAVTGSFDVSAMAFRVLWGRNTNATTGINLVVSWSFSPAQVIKKNRAPKPVPETP